MTNATQAQKQPWVSVLMPAYNDGAFLRTSIESVLAQSLGDFELIVSDDGSTDETASITRQYCRDDARIRLLTDQPNVGMTANWNRALRAAQGKFVMKLDADDAYHPSLLSAMVEAIQASPQPSIAFCRTLDCDTDLRPYSSYLGDAALIRKGIDPLSPHNRRGLGWYPLCFDDIQLWHSNAGMFPREVLLALRGWDEAWGCASDTDLILRVLELDLPVVHVPYAGVLYRHRAGSVSAQYRKQATLAWESALVHLGSLNRYHAKGGALATPLRKAWWRHWQNWLKLRATGEGSLQSLREDARARLLQRAGQLAPPPWRIRVEGQARQWAWNLLHDS